MYGGLGECSFEIIRQNVAVRRVGQTVASLRLAFSLRSRNRTGGIVSIMWPVGVSSCVYETQYFSEAEAVYIGKSCLPHPCTPYYTQNLKILQAAQN